MRKWLQNRLDFANRKQKTYRQKIAKEFNDTLEMNRKIRAKKSAIIKLAEFKGKYGQ